MEDRKAKRIIGKGCGGKKNEPHSHNNSTPSSSHYELSLSQDFSICENPLLKNGCDQTNNADTFKSAVRAYATYLGHMNVSG